MSAHERWRDRNPELYQESRRKSRERRYEWLRDQKRKPCQDCGGTFPAAAMEFHHRDPTDKAFSIGRCRQYSQARLEAEIAKCDILCANCHQIREAS